MKRTGGEIYEKLMRRGIKRDGAGTPKRQKKGADAAREEETLRPLSGPPEGGGEGRRGAMEMDCLAVRFTPTNQPIFMLKGGKY